MTAIILPSRSPSGSPVYAPTNRPVYRGGAAAFWTQFFGPSDNGYVFDGSQSRFYTDSAMTTLATASGTDPVGAIEDVSGKGNHALQSTSANKPVYVENGTIKGINGGVVSAVKRWLSVTADLSAAFTLYAVIKKSSAGNGWPAVASLDASASLAYWIGRDSNQRQLTVFDGGGAAKASTTVISTSDLMIAKVVRSGTGAGGLAIKISTINNVESQTGTGTSTGTGTGKTMTVGGDPNDASESQHGFFYFYNTRALTAGEQSSVESEIASRFGGLV